MSKLKNRFILIANIIRFAPHILIFKFCRNKYLILKDIQRWAEILKFNSNDITMFVKLLSSHKEFRNIFYYRIGFLGSILKRFYPGERTLFINSKFIGGGLYIEHGFSTIILAHSVGENCWINQQVTIGFNHDDMPTIGNNVRITAGAKVIGGITIGDNVLVGANCVVPKNVPANCTVVGIPAKIIKKNGVAVNEKL